MSDRKHSKAKLLTALIASALIFGFAGWLFLNRTYVADQISVWSFKPSVEVQSIDNKVGFADKGTFYFYASQPSVDSAETFNKGCPRQEVGNPILGCYTMGKIYVYDVKNEQLDGIEEVTAAHEMLHAAWERMSDSEKKSVAALLRTEYAKVTDVDFKERMDYYARTEPGEFENELHSIIGTEFTAISPELETYYKKFFKDRSRVVTMHQKYNAVFKDLESQSNTLFSQLETLGKSIETRTVQYNSDVTQLTADIQSFNSRADNGDFSSISQFNSERAALVARTTALSNDRDSLNSDIASYNLLYERYQSLSVQINELNSSIDSVSQLKPAPSL